MQVYLGQANGEPGDAERGQAGDDQERGLEDLRRLAPIGGGIGQRHLASDHLRKPETHIAEVGRHGGQREPLAIAHCAPAADKQRH